tara:strand:+ start:54 stop:1829 length:1776 start_codon:yes stop_codon:yes gene_type:complete
MSKIVANNISPRSGDTVSVTGNISVGGTLTYEDVTNIDSVGMITARKGIQVLADGINAVGVMTATTFSGSGANLTNIPSGQLTGALPAIDGSALTGIQVGTRDFVGYGTNITAGKPVGLGSDGTVRAIKETGSADPTLGSDTEWESGAAIRFGPRGMVYDTQNDKVIITYSDYGDSSKGKCVVGEVNSGSNTITFGSPVEFSSNDVRFISSLFSPDNNKVVVFFADNGNNDYATYNVGQVNGLSFGWSSSGNTTMYSNAIKWNALVFDTSNNKLVFIWNNQGNEVRSVTGDVESNDTLSLGSTQEITSDDPGASNATIGAVYHTAAGKTVAFWNNATQSNYGYYAVATYSSAGGGNSQTWSTPAPWSTANPIYIATAYDPATERIVIVYSDSDNSGYGTAVVASLSGTTLTMGTPVVFNTANTEEISVCMDTTNSKVVISFNDHANSQYATVIVGTIGGSNNRSISFGNKVAVNSALPATNSVVFDPDTARVVVAYNDGNLTGTGRAKVIEAGGTSSTNLTAENYIGLAAAGISSGSTGTITIPGGISSGHTGLTTGRTYYVQADGTLATSASSPQVVAGTSISATEILVR